LELMMGLALNSIVRGDCVAVLQDIPAGTVDFVLTDPPYLVNYLDRSGRSVANDRLAEADWVVPAFAGIYRAMKPNSFCVSFYGWSAVDRFFEAWRRAGLRPVGHLTFPKGYASSTRMLRYQHEGAYLLAKGRPAPPADPIPDVIPWRYSGNKWHPTQKPTCILSPLVRSFCPPGGLVLDPFAGSGSTLVTAAALGRAYLGIELDAATHATACDRLRVMHAALSTPPAADGANNRTRRPQHHAAAGAHREAA
jgi:adenine-specific DNA-methyltransferase